jgi:hypothetical protein
MVSRLTLVPGEKLGVVVLTNQEVGAAFNAITLSVLDAYLGGEARLGGRLCQGRGQGPGQGRRGLGQASSARDKGSRPSLPLAGYTGTFRDRWYGDMQSVPQARACACAS